MDFSDLFLRGYLTRLPTEDERARIGTGRRGAPVEEQLQQIAQTLPELLNPIARGILSGQAPPSLVSVSSPALPVVSCAVIQGEKAIYSDQFVSISPTRVMFHDTTYAVRNITSVRIVGVSEPATSSGAAAMLILGGVVALFVGFVYWIFFLLGAALFTFGLVGAAGVKSKPSYQLHLTTAAGQVNVLASSDYAYLYRVMDSINEAIARCR